MIQLAIHMEKRTPVYAILSALMLFSTQISLAAEAGSTMPTQASLIKQIMINAKRPNLLIQNHALKPIGHKDQDLKYKHNICDPQIDSALNESPHKGKDAGQICDLSETSQYKDCVDQSESAIKHNEMVTIQTSTYQCIDGQLLVVKQSNTGPQPATYKPCEASGGQTILHNKEFSQGDAICHCNDGTFKCVPKLESEPVIKPSKKELPPVKRSSNSKREQAEGCAISARDNTGKFNFLLSIFLFLPLIILRRKQKLTPNYLGLKILLLTVLMSWQCSNNDDAGTKDISIEINQNRQAILMSFYNLLLVFDENSAQDDPQYTVFFIKAMHAVTKDQIPDTPPLTPSNNNQNRNTIKENVIMAPIPTKFSTMTKADFQRITRFSQGEKLPDSELARLFNNDRFSLYQAKLDGQAIWAKILRDTSNPSAMPIVHLYANLYLDNDQISAQIIGKYKSQDYKPFAEHEQTSQGIAPPLKKYLLMESFFESEASRLKIKYAAQIGSDLLAFDALAANANENSTANNNTNENATDNNNLQGQLNNEITFLKRYGFLADAFIPDPLTTTSQIEAYWQKTLAPQLDDSISRPERKSKTRSFTSLYLCNFDPILLETTADLCQITGITPPKNTKPGIILLQQNFDQERLTSLPNFVIASAASQATIANTVSLWKFITTGSPDIPVIWNENNNHAATSDPQSSAFYNYPTRLFTAEQIPGMCVSRFKKIGAGETKIARLYNTLTGACINETQCRQQGLINLSIDFFYALKGSQVKGLPVKTTKAESDYFPTTIRTQIPQICTEGQDLLAGYKENSCPQDPLQSHSLVIYDGQLPENPVCVDFHICHHNYKNGLVIPLASIATPTHKTALNRFYSPEFHGEKFVCIPGDSGVAAQHAHTTRLSIDEFARRSQSLYITQPFPPFGSEKPALEED